MSEPGNNRAGKTLRLLKTAFDDVKNVQEPQDKTRTSPLQGGLYALDPRKAPRRAEELGVIRLGSN